MRLADLITGGQLNQSKPQVQQAAHASDPAQTMSAGRQIRTLAPGQTLQGEVVGRNGSEVQIKLSDDTVVNARVDRNVNLEVGKNLTFEVRSNGQALTLSPLFANTATDANVLKALDMASLPANQSTVSMTELMMGAGLSIDRNALQHMFREINAFPGADAADIVDLHKLGLAVNEENLNQISSYKNLTHQLVEGMHTVLGTMPETLQDMVQDGNAAGAARMFGELLQMIQELPGEEALARSEEGAVQELPTGAEGAQAAQPGGEHAQALQAGADGARILLTGENPEQMKQIITEMTDVDELLTAMSDKDVALKEAADKAGSAALGAEDGESVSVLKQGGSGDEGAAVDVNMTGLPLSKELSELLGTRGADSPYGELLKQLAAAEEKGEFGDQARVLQQIVRQGLQDNDQPLLEHLVTGSKTQKFLTEGLSKLWTIEPREVADEGRVDELYQRLGRQLKTLTHVLEQNGETSSGTYKAAANMNQNLDFLQQLNQAYTYVQLPLRLQQNDAHGDLYVYTNKRNLAAKDGQISALLHLDMEHLGPVDVYVAMQAEKVNTRFYVQDDEMLDFLEEHMDLLTERLQKRGYQCSFEMQVRQSGEEPKSGLPGLLQEEQTAQSLGRYAFDMRA